MNTRSLFNLVTSAAVALSSLFAEIHAHSTHHHKHKSVHYTASELVHATNLSRLTPSLDCLRLSFDPAESPDTWARNTEDESWLAINPTDPDNMIIVTHQDGYDGIFLSDIVVYTLDGGKTWNESDLTLSRCQGPTLVGADNDFESASDPFVTFDKEGNAYVFVTSFNIFENFEEANVLAKSTDGGRSWGHLTAVTRDDGNTHFLDKPSITCDPYRKDTVYTLWSDFLELVGSGNNNITFSKSIDAGASWSDPISIIDFDLGTRGWGAMLEVLPDEHHTLVVTVCSSPNDRSSTPTPIFSIRSKDGGTTWSPFTVVSDSVITEPVDPDLGIGVRAFSIGADLAQNEKKGYLYLVWQDPRYNPSGECGSVISMSKDGGKTWTTPIPVNPTTLDVQTFLPAVAVAKDGTVGVLFYDFRFFKSGDASLKTDVWISLFDKDLKHYLGEVRLTEEFFDYRQADRGAACRFFLGDYCCLQSIGNDFAASFAITNPPYGIGPSLVCPVTEFTEDFRNRDDVVFTIARRCEKNQHEARNGPMALGNFKRTSQEILQKAKKRGGQQKVDLTKMSKEERIRHHRKKTSGR